MASSALNKEGCRITPAGGCARGFASRTLRRTARREDALAQHQSEIAPTRRHGAWAALWTMWRGSLSRRSSAVCRRRSSARAIAHPFGTGCVRKIDRHVRQTARSGPTLARGERRPDRASMGHRAGTSWSVRGEMRQAGSGCFLGANDRSSGLTCGRCRFWRGLRTAKRRSFPGTFLTDTHRTCIVSAI